MNIDKETKTVGHVEQNVLATPPRIIIGVGFLLASMGYYFDKLAFADGIDYKYILFIALGIIVLGLMLDIYTYLRGATTVRYSMEAFHKTQQMIEQLRVELQDVKDQSAVFAAERGKVLLSPEDIAEVKDRTVEGLGKDVLDRIATTIRAEVAEKTTSEQATQIITAGIGASQERLIGEVESLGRRANVNLTIGFAVSLVGIISLAIFVWMASAELDANINWQVVVVRFLTKLSLVVFMQVFAYFFLRLYRYSLYEIKYFQNEITNIEQKYVALNVVMQSGNKDDIAKIASELSKVERNFILKKGETTVGLQREEIEARYDATVSAKAQSLIEKASSIMRPAAR